MYVVSYCGFLHGPFETPEEAAKYGRAPKIEPGPWTIIPIVPPSGIRNEVSINDGPGVRRLIESLASKRGNRGPVVVGVDVAGSDKVGVATADVRKG